MKYPYKNLLRLFLFIIIAYQSEVALGQYKTYPWQLGVGIGYANYYGDLSNYRIKGAGELYQIYKFADYNKHYQYQPSLSVLLQKKLTPTLGVMFQVNNMQFAMSDRYKKTDGSLDTVATNFSRSLNFKTSLQDVGFAFTFSPNNGRIGSERAFFYPSFYLGLGVSKFDVRGDLYDAKNIPYNYRMPGDINDGNFETDLRQLRTETDTRFRNVEPYVDIGLALNFRISQFVHIALQSDIKYSASDYLDDVSATYKSFYPTTAEAYAAKPGFNTVTPGENLRGDNNGVNDFYINNRVVLSISLPRKKPATHFNSPVIYSLSSPFADVRKKISDSTKNNGTIKVDSVVRYKTDSVVTLLRDSLNTMKAIPLKTISPFDSVVMKQLYDINTEVKDIRKFLAEQQIGQRLQQIQQQTDSIKTLKSVLMLVKPRSRENNLLLRIYDLQLDSLQNELDKEQRIKKFPTGTSDSIMVSNALPDTSIKITNTDQVSIDGLTNDSLLIRKLNLAKIDSIKHRLNELENSNANTSQLNVADENLAFNRTRDSLNFLKNKAEFEQSLEQKELALQLLNQQLRAAVDSAAYYKQLRNNTSVPAAPDSVQKKSPWYKRYLGIGRRPRKSAETKDTANSPDHLSKQRFYESEANLASRKISTIEKDEADLALQRINFVSENELQVDSAEKATNLQLLRKNIQQNTDSISVLQRRLKSSNDSALYYKQRILAANEINENDNRKWYQEMFRSEKSKREKLESSNELSQNNIERQQYYDTDIKNMRARILELERYNSVLQTANKSYDADSYGKRRDNNFPVAPDVVYSDDRSSQHTVDNREIETLRAQLQVLQKEVNENITAKSKADTTSLPQTQQINVMPVPIYNQATDSSQIASLRHELAELKDQLDSMKAPPVPVLPLRSDSREQLLDVTTFPVISVYFNTGSATLAKEQLDKISPFGRMASANANARIVLKGFTDPVGNPEKNKVIAQKRSLFIKDLLITSFKIDETRIVIEAAGGNKLKAARKANPLDRRVDLQLR